MYGFGLRLKTLREQRELSQKQLAVKINKSTAAISSYECDRQIPPTEVMQSIAKALGVSLGYLVGNEEIAVYSSDSFSCSQQEVIELLFSEFVQPTSNDGVLSEQQIQILQKLIFLFSAPLSDNAK